MALQQPVDTFLESDEDEESDDNKIQSLVQPPSPKKRKLSHSTNNSLYIIKIGPFSLSKSSNDILRFVFINKQIIPCDIELNIVNNNSSYAYIGYKTFNEANGTIHKYKYNKSINICKIMNNNNKSSKIYDRSSYSHSTEWIKLYGIPSFISNSSIKNQKKWIEKLLNWSFMNNNKQQLDILNIKMFFNVKYKQLNGFALIQFKNNKITQNIVKYFQKKWINNLFKYWIDYHFMDMDDLNSNQTATETNKLLFLNLNWKVNKTILKDYMFKMNNDIAAQNICVIATSNGYPTGKAVVTFDSANDAKLIKDLCDNNNILFDESINVRFYNDTICNAIKKTKKTIKKTVRFDIEKEESDDGDDDDSDNNNDDDDDDDDDNDNDDDFRLNKKDIIGLWKWKNPSLSSRKYPSGLLSNSKRSKKRNWKEFYSKDWLKEWNKREYIDGKERLWIRSGNLVHASTRWRQRVKGKNNKKKQRK